MPFVKICHDVLYGPCFVVAAVVAEPPWLLPWIEFFSLRIGRKRTSAHTEECTYIELIPDDCLFCQSCFLLYEGIQNMIICLRWQFVRLFVRSSILIGWIGIGIVEMSLDLYRWYWVSTLTSRLDRVFWLFKKQSAFLHFPFYLLFVPLKSKQANFSKSGHFFRLCAIEWNSCTIADK